MILILVTAQVESDARSVHGENKRTFGVLTVTSSTNIDNYFATKLAKLRTRAKKDKSSFSDTVSAVGNHNASEDRHEEQTGKQQTAAVSLETVPVDDRDVGTVKQHRKKRKEAKADDSDCHINDEQLDSKSPKSNGMSKKKKKRCHVDDSTEVKVEFDSNNMNVRSYKRKKGLSVTTPACEMTQSEHTGIRSKKRKKSKRVDCQTR